MHMNRSLCGCVASWLALTAAPLLAQTVNPTPYAGTETGTYLHYNMDALNGTWDPTETVALLDNSGNNRHSTSSVRRSRMSDLNGSLFGKAVLARLGPTTPAAAMADLDFTGDFYDRNVV